MSFWAESYGTHLALQTIRRHEGTVDRAVLVGPEGPDHALKLPSQAQEALVSISALIATEPGLGEQIPDLTAMIARVLARLDKAPVTADVDGQPIGISRFDVQWLLSNLIGQVRGKVTPSGRTRPHHVPADARFTTSLHHCAPRCVTPPRTAPAVHEPDARPAPRSAD